MLTPGRTSRALWIIAGVGLCLRLAWMVYAHPDPVSDFEYYRRMAADLLDHHQLGYPKLSASRVPGYPVLLAGAMLVSRSVSWLRLVNVLLSAALVPVAARLARGLALPPAAVLTTAALVAVAPDFVLFAPVLASEHLFALLLLLALVVALGATHRGRVVCCGVLTGVTILTRPDALFYLPVIAGVLAWRAPGRRIAAPALCLVTAGLVVMPWYVRNRVELGPGAGISTVGGMNFYFAHNDVHYGWQATGDTPLAGMNEVAMQARGYALGLDYLEHAGWLRIVEDIAAGTGGLYSPQAYPFASFWSTLAAGTTPDDSTPNALARLWWVRQLGEAYRIVLYGAVLSVLVARRFPRGAAPVLYGLVAMSWLGYAVVFWADPRYRYVAEIAFCLLTALALTSRQDARRGDDRSG